ncbi:MAG: aminotransferase class I/II-fold pyridoxal phosphate-dependent enzyme [Candidatus Helarchaeota archaeon]
MRITASERLNSIGSYAFADVDLLVEKLKANGIVPTDFGVGDPKDPTPEFIRNAAKQAIDKFKSYGYPSYIGSREFRETIQLWYKKRYNVDLDVDKEISSTIGSKEAVFNFHEAIINPGDIVIIPTPGYPPYERGTLFAEGVPYFLPLLEENDFLPDFKSIDEKIFKKVKLIWINYPNNPTTAMAPKEFFEELIEFARQNDIIIGSDEAYSENYYYTKPLSILEFTKEGVIVFHSLSKRSNMTGYRVGWVAGDPEIISIFKKVKTNIDSGTPRFIQEAAIAALNNETHVKQIQEQYLRKRNIMIDAFTKIGLPKCEPRATIYIWQKVPENMNCVDFAKKLLSKEIAIVCTPGAWISKEVNGINPGEKFVRFALVPTLEETMKAADRLIQNY